MQVERKDIPDGGSTLLYPGKGGGDLWRVNVESTGKLRVQEVMELDYSNVEHVQLFEKVFGCKLGERMPDEFYKQPPYQVIEVKSIEAKARSNLHKDTSATVTSETTQNSTPVVKTEIYK